MPSPASDSAPSALEPSRRSCPGWWLRWSAGRHLRQPPPATPQRPDARRPSSSGRARHDRLVPRPERCASPLLASPTPPARRLIARRRRGASRLRRRRTPTSPGEICHCERWADPMSCRPDAEWGPERPCSRSCRPWSLYGGLNRNVFDERPTPSTFSLGRGRGARAGCRGRPGSVSRQSGLGGTDGSEVCSSSSSRGRAGSPAGDSGAGMSSGPGSAGAVALRPGVSMPARFPVLRRVNGSSQQRHTAPAGASRPRRRGGARGWTALSSNLRSRPRRGRAPTGPQRCRGFRCGPSGSFACPVFNAGYEHSPAS